jgi:hypothetical protein
MKAMPKLQGLLVSSAAMACLLAACGGRSDSGNTGNAGNTGNTGNTGANGGTGNTGATAGAGENAAAGIWSGSLAPDDPSGQAMSGWLVIGADGRFSLDTDAALYLGDSALHDQAVSVSAAVHPYGNDTDGTVAFNATIADGTMTGTWTGNGSAGTLQFKRQQQISKQQASLATIASDYSGELWIRDARLPARVTIASDGALHASTDSGCALEGRVSIADAARNAYGWSANASGCPTNGEARGDGFVIDGYSLYLDGTLQGTAIWLGGVDSRAPTP